MKTVRSLRRVLSGLALATAVLFGGAAGAVLGTCGPFTDVAADSFCPAVLEIFYLGITSGTTATTYDPASNVSRLQMAAFLSRTVDRVLHKASRRAAMNQFWLPQATVLGLTTVGSNPSFVAADGLDVWVSNAGSASWSISRVRASDGRLLETWTAAVEPHAILPAMGRVLIVGAGNRLYMLDPSQPAGSVDQVSTALGVNPNGIAFDGVRVWTANEGGSVSIVSPGTWTVTTVTTAFQSPAWALYDGSNIWITDAVAGTLLKLNGAGAILQTVTVGLQPFSAVFDGTSIWVPNSGSDSVTVVRASNGTVLQTLTGNGLNLPASSAFDGERILITNYNGNSVSFWKAADLTPLGTSTAGINVNPFGVCSDGVNFWVALAGTNKLARF